MKALRVTASVALATERLQRFAQLGTELALAETARNDAIASANADADKVTAPIVAEMAAIRAEVEPWWARNGAALLTGKRKTIELGGCILGTKTGSSSLSYAGGDDKAATAALQAERWANLYVRVGYSLDKTAIGAALKGGTHAAKLKALGFDKPAGTEGFVLDRVVQEGTVGA